MTSYRTLLLGGAFVLSAVAPAIADTNKAIPGTTTTQSSMIASAALTPAEMLFVLEAATSGLLAI